MDAWVFFLKGGGGGSVVYYMLWTPRLTATRINRGVVRGRGGEQPGGVRLPEEPRHAAERDALADRRVLPGSVYLCVCV